MVMGMTNSSKREVTDLILGSPTSFYNGQVRVGSVLWQKMEIVVVEGPDIQLRKPKTSKEEVHKLMDTMSLLSPGPHLFLYVLDTTSRKEIKLFETILALLGGDAHKHFVVLLWAPEEIELSKLFLIPFLWIYFTSVKQKYKWTHEDICSEIKLFYGIRRREHFVNDLQFPHSLVVSALLAAGDLEKNADILTNTCDQLLKLDSPPHIAVSILSHITSKASDKMNQINKILTDHVRGEIIKHYVAVSFQIVNFRGIVLSAISLPKRNFLFKLFFKSLGSNVSCPD